MKTYKITFTCEGTISKLPSSQAIFGAVCNIIANTKGESELHRYFKSFQNKPLFIHSSMFYGNTVPMVRKPLLQIADVTTIIKQTKANLQLDMLNQMKQLKQATWMSENVLKKYVLNGEVSEITLALYNRDIINKNGIIQEKIEKNEYSMSSVLLTKVKTDKVRTLDGDSRDLYYDVAMYGEKNQEYQLFVKSNESMEYLHSVFSLFDYFPIGNRKSVGKNLFSFTSIEEYTIDSSAKKFKMLLSSCLPKANDFNLLESYYQIEQRIHRTSNHFLNNVLMGEFTMLLEGSYMLVQDNKEYYGQCLPIQVQGKTVYYYGIGFVL